MPIVYDYYYLAPGRYWYSYEVGPTLIIVNSDLTITEGGTEVDIEHDIDVIGSFAVSE